MPRARTVKPDFFTDADLCELPPLHRILYEGLWCHADRRGVFSDKPRELKTKILPYDPCDVDAMLWDLHQAGFLRRYTAQGHRCGHLPKLGKHQHFHKDEKVSDLPGPEDKGAAETLKTRQTAAHVALAPEEHRADTGPAPEEHRANTPVICNLVTGSVAGAGSKDPRAPDAEPLPTEQQPEPPREQSLAERLVAVFSEAFARSKGIPFRIGTSFADGEALRRVLSWPEATEVEFRRRAERAFADGWFRDKADLPLFVKQWNRWGQALPEAEERPPPKRPATPAERAWANALDWLRAEKPYAAEMLDRMGPLALEASGALRMLPPDRHYRTWVLENYAELLRELTAQDLGFTDIVIEDAGDLP